MPLLVSAFRGNTESTDEQQYEMSTRTQAQQLREKVQIVPNWTVCLIVPRLLQHPCAGAGGLLLLTPSCMPGRSTKVPRTPAQNNRTSAVNQSGHEMLLLERSW
jgi:hypothetical protein